MMEGQFFFTTVAGLAVSIAGFAALIAWLRDDSRTWDPINLWRVKNIVREAFTLVFLALALIPVFHLTGDLGATIRFGAFGIVLSIVRDVLINRHPDPAIWKPKMSWTLYLTFSGLLAALQLVNIRLASLGILQIGFLLNLLSPAGIFSNFVRELGRHPVPSEHLPEVDPRAGSSLQQIAEANS
jgi:hypothetical protein